MTHAELVKLAERWLRKKNHPVVLADVRCNSVSEQPDAIGWKNHGWTTLVECKVSLSDGRADRYKSFRREPELGMGYWRWLMAPVAIGEKIARPIGWGLLVVHGDANVRIAHRAGLFPERNRDAEATLLVRAVRAATESWGRRMFGDIAPPLVDGDPHPTASRLLRDLRVENRRLTLELRAAKQPVTEGTT